MLLLRIELALLVLIAAGSLEEAFQLSSNPQLTMTKIAGAICFASFARYALTSRRPLLFDRSHAVVIGILLIALASTVQAFDTSVAVTTTTRYASFVALYVIVSQFVGAHRLQRQIAWVLTITAAVAAVIALRELLRGRHRRRDAALREPERLRVHPRDDAAALVLAARATHRAGGYRSSPRSA